MKSYLRRTSLWKSALHLFCQNSIKEKVSLQVLSRVTRHWYLNTHTHSHRGRDTRRCQQPSDTRTRGKWFGCALPAVLALCQSWLTIPPTSRISQEFWIFNGLILFFVYMLKPYCSWWEISIFCLRTAGFGVRASWQGSIKEWRKEGISGSFESAQFSDPRLMVDCYTAWLDTVLLNFWVYLISFSCIYMFKFLAVLGLCCCIGFSSRWLLLLRSMGFGACGFQQLWLPSLAAPRHVGSSPIRDQTHVSCIGRWILYHWATREAPAQTLLKGMTVTTRIMRLVSTKPSSWVGIHGLVGEPGCRGEIWQLCAARFCGALHGKCWAKKGLRRGWMVGPYLGPFCLKQNGKLGFPQTQ